MAADPDFAQALGRGMARFAAFVNARSLDLDAIQPEKLRGHIQKSLD